MRENWERRTTICTPTFLLTRNSVSASAALGWCVFIMFILAMVMCLVGVFSVLSAGFTLLVRNLCLIALCFAMYVCLICLFLIDVLSSLDASLAKIAKGIDKIEEIQYNQYLLATKSSPRRKDVSEQDEILTSQKSS